MLAAISVVSLLYRLLTILNVVNIRFSLLRSRARTVDPQYVYALSKKLDIGDWFVLYQLSNNLDPLVFRDILLDLAGPLDVDVDQKKTIKIV